MSTRKVLSWLLSCSRRYAGCGNGIGVDRGTGLCRRNWCRSAIRFLLLVQRCCWRSSKSGRLRRQLDW
eukprot:2187290-Pleurochrysis_carterae.AAC.1